MSKYSENNFLKSFSYALRGIKLAFKSQPNIQRQCIAAFLVILLACFFKFNYFEFIVLFIVIAMVIVTEMVNSAIEFSIDAILKNKYSKLAGMAKDISAGAVCITSFLAVIIGLLLFFNKF